MDRLESKRTTQQSALVPIVLAVDAVVMEVVQRRMQRVKEVDPMMTMSSRED